MITVISGLFVDICLLFTLSNMIVFWRKFSVQRVFRKMEWHWETQKKFWEKRVGKDQVVQPNSTSSSWHKLEYVEQVVQGETGLQIYAEQVEQGEGGLQIVVKQVEQGQGVCPAEPLHLSQLQSGSTRLWTFSACTLQSKLWWSWLKVQARFFLNFRVFIRQ